MAQRVYLFGASTRLLEQVQRFVSTPGDRERICVEMGKSAETHQRAVAASERVIASIHRKVRDADQNTGFAYAANALPYFIAASDVEGVLAAMDWLEQPRKDPELEAFFSAQGAALGLSCGQLRRDEYAARGAIEIAQAVAHYLEFVAAQHEAAVLVAEEARPNLWERIAATIKPKVERGAGASEQDVDNQLASYGAAMWRALGMLLGRLGPAWWQGRDRWLGYLAYREDFKYRHVTMTERTPGNPQSVSVVPAAATVLPASEAAGELRRLLRSTSSLAPALAFREWDRRLKPSGDANGTCGFLDAAGARTLASRLDGERWSALKSDAVACFGTEVEDWRITVCAAARWAEKRGLYLIEGDEIFDKAYRWPPL